MPPRPMTDLIVRSPGFTLAALEACCDAMFGFGHAGSLPPRCPRLGVGPLPIHLHHLLVVAVAVAEHDDQLRVALLPPGRTRHHTSFDPVDHPRPFGAVAHGDPFPSALVKRCTPRLHALPGPLRAAPPAAVCRRCRLQVTPQRVPRDRQQRALAEAIEPTTTPRRTTHVVIARNPPMWQGGAVLLQPFPRPLVTGAVAPLGWGHTGFVQASLLLGPCFGAGLPHVHQVGPLAETSPTESAT